jgi:CRP-like cAMP-binding protein
MEHLKTEKKSIKKGEILQRAGEQQPKAYLVTHGLLRVYMIDEKGKEHVFMFAPEDWIAGDIGAIVNEDSSQLFIDAIEDSEIEIIQSRFPEDVAHLGVDFYVSELKRSFKRVAVLQKRVLMLLSNSALTRYQDFVETYPNIVERVPQKMIASYLGVTPEALSKIRSEWARGK